jgi:hypothetical protein
MPPVRASALQVAEHCDLAATLAAEHPRTSADIETGRAVDAEACAELADGPKAKETDAQAVVWWVRHNLCGVYVQEPVRVADPKTGEILSPGTPDVYGRLIGDVEEGNADRIVVVDIKKREQYYAGNLAPPDQNMQLHAYAIALAQKYQVRSYQTCLLLFGDGAVQELWSQTYTEPEWRPFLDRIRKIHEREKARGDKRPVGQSGPHCLECYQRRHCPHWVLPATAPESALAPLALPGGLTAENSGRALLAWMQLGDLYEQVKPLLQEYALAKGGITVGEKVWGPISVRGRASASVKDLEAAGLQSYIRHGEPSVRYGWKRKG